jgi:hypothetical protein
MLGKKKEKLVLVTHMHLVRVMMTNQINLFHLEQDNRDPEVVDEVVEDVEQVEVVDPQLVYPQVDLEEMMIIKEKGEIMEVFEAVQGEVEVLGVEEEAQISAEEVEEGVQGLVDVEAEVEEEAGLVVVVEAYHKLNLINFGKK